MTTLDRRTLLTGTAAVALAVASRAQASLLLLGAGPATDTRTITTDPGVLQVNALGWNVNFSSPPTFAPATAPQFVVVSRQGYTTAATTTTYTDTLILTQRMRQLYPNQDTLDSTLVSLSDYVYSTDTIVGSASNASTLASPTPICQWIIPDRQTIDSSLKAEIVAFHVNARNFEQVAAVVFTATDGTNTVTATVSQSAVSTESTDQNKIISYSATLDISTLNNNSTITLNAKVYPWIGGSTSIADSSVNTAGTRTFCPQVYYKNTSRAGTPVFAYVDVSTGVDTGNAARVSTNASTARASPYATINGAIKGLTVYNADISGYHIRLMAGTQALSAITYIGTTFNPNGELIIEADPLAAAGTVTLSLATSVGFGGQVGIHYLRIQNNINVVRTATSQIGLVSGGMVTLYNCTYTDATSLAMLSTPGTRARLMGVTIASPTGGLLNPSINYEVRLVRGVLANWGGTSNTYVDMFCVVGSSISGLGGGLVAPSADVYSGGIVAFDTFPSTPIGAGGFYNMAGTAAYPMTNIAFCQNVVEAISGANVAFRPSSDTPSAGTMVHFVAHHNTLTGYNNNGRSNVLYNSTVGTNRQHTLTSLKGNIHVQINNKGDWFATNSALSLTPYLYGVGCNGEIASFLSANGSANGTHDAFTQEYGGLNGKFGTSATVPLTMNWSNYQAMTASNGAGGGTYTITAGSVAIGNVPVPTLRYDIAGTTRHLNGASGAYEY